MKYRIETQKPNIFKKKLHSEILNQNFHIWISSKTRKCIMKQGSLDKYLLNSNPAHIDSKYGLYLKQLIKQKLENPTANIGYIKGTATAKRTRKTKVWQYRQIPAVYTPAHIRQTTDMSLFYEKPPSEMSRYELQELEQFMREEELGEEAEEEEEEEVLDEEGNPIDKEVLFKQTDEYFETREEIAKL